MLDWRLREMIGKKPEKLAKVAPIGLDRMGGKLALGHQIDEPGVDRAFHIRRGADRFHFLSFGGHRAPRLVLREGNKPEAAVRPG